jgi:hypothetical protein
MCDMVSGLKLVLIPSGQMFFAIKYPSSVKLTDASQRWISMATETAHEKITNSNFITEIDENLRSLVIFGPGTIYSDWKPGIGLVYKTLEIGTYQLVEDDSKNVESIYIKFQLSALNARNNKDFGNNLGAIVAKAAEKLETQNQKFWFLHVVRPRNKRNRSLSNSINMEYESVFIDIIDEKIVYEGGYKEFSYHTARWMRPCSEKDGRGIGTEMLPQTRVLNRMAKDFLMVGNRHADPPYERTDEVESPVDKNPGGENIVSRIGSIKALDMNMLGNFNITEKDLDRQTALIHRAWYRDAFNPLDELTGDRRTTLEIRQRIKQTWHKIGPPIARVWYEQLTKCIRRSVLLLIRNGDIPYPPYELWDSDFGIEFVGPFALEMRSQQAKAFQEWSAWVASLEEAFPGASDNVDIDDAIMRAGRTMGVNTEDMSTEEERAAKRQKRDELERIAIEAQQEEIAAKAYNQGTKAPEKGSASEKLMKVNT